MLNVLSNSLRNKMSTLGFSKHVIVGVIKILESLKPESEFKKYGKNKNVNRRK